jgi:hypothetical protein
MDIEGLKPARDRKAQLELVVKVYNINHGHNILRGFFESNGSEVFNMLTDEWNWDEYMEVTIEEAREEGRELGHEKGWESGHEKGIEKVMNFSLLFSHSSFFPPCPLCLRVLSVIYFEESLENTSHKGTKIHEGTKVRKKIKL